MTKLDIIKRWENKESEVILNKVIECLNFNKPLSNISGLEIHNGRLDLRGAKLSLPKKERHIESSGYKTIQKLGSLHVKNSVITSVDFSYADISYSMWEKCKIIDCLFYEAEAKELRISACDIHKCTFERTNLFHSFLNKNIGANSGSFKDVKFIHSNLSKSIFYFPLIEYCIFEYCQLKEVDFDGSRFSNCSFKGIFDSGWIRGYSIHAQKSILGIFNRINPQDFPNKMKNVDFSQVEMNDVLFSQKVDLRNCKFPQKGNFLLIQNIPSTYIKVRELIEKEWQGDDKRKALFIIDNLYNSDIKKGMPIDYIDTNYNQHLGEDFQNKFFTLLKSVDSKISLIEKG